MRSALRLAVAVLALAALAPVALAQPVRGQATYTVRPGDTLYGIARASGVSVDELRRLNGIPGDALEVGQVLRLSARAPATPPTASGGRGVHVVQPGETLYAVARRYGTTVDEVRRLNGIVGDYIAAGQRLTVPGGAAAPPPGTPPPTPRTPPVASGDPRVTAPLPTTAPATAPPLRLGTWRIDNTTVPADMVHFVEPGETLYSIAVRFGFSVEQLTSVNELTTAPIPPGTILVLPAPVDPSTPLDLVLPASDTTGLALVYDEAFEGQPTASGESYRPDALTAAHRTLPLGSVVLVTNTTSGRSVFVRINDRGPLSSAYVLELSAAAADALELDPNAARRVELRLLP